MAHAEGGNALTGKGSLHVVQCEEWYPNIGQNAGNVDLRWYPAAVVRVECPKHLNEVGRRCRSRTKAAAELRGEVGW